DHNLDTSPPAMLQGANRFERGSIFFDYLQDYYGPGILNRQVRETVPGVGHDSTAMYASGPALKWLFDFNGWFSRDTPGFGLPNVGTYPLTTNPVTRDGFGGPACGTVQGLTVNGLGGACVVTGNPVPTAISSGAGDDGFRIGNGDLDNLAGPVDIHDSNGRTIMQVDDTLTSTGQTDTAPSTTVTRPGGATITYPGL